MVGLIEKGFGRSPAGGTSCSNAPYIYGFISLMVHILVCTMKLRESQSTINRTIFRFINNKGRLVLKCMKNLLDL